MTKRKKKRKPSAGRSGPSLTSEAKKPAGAEGKVSPRAFGPVVRRAPSSGKKRRRKKKTSRIRRFFKWLFSTRTLIRLASLALTLCILGGILLLYFARDLPDISGLGAANKAPGIRIVAADGEVIGTYGQIYGEYQHYEDLPPDLVEALLATEDRRFYRHWGVDPQGIARAMVVNMRAGSFVQGGSTITQQLAKNVFLTPERTIKRKIQEMMLAFWLEARFSKKEIISIYLNRVYLGAGNYGVDAASRYYFEKPVGQLSLPEAAMIAGLLKAPSRYAPTSSPERTVKRTREVLRNLVEVGKLAPERVEPLLRDLKFPERIISDDVAGLHYFADWIVESIPQYLSKVEEDIIVETTLEPVMQTAAERAIDEVMTPGAVEKNKAHEVALVAMRPDGAITAMMGGRNYRKSQFNRATQAKRQPGSSFKMFVYLTAMELGYRPDFMIEDKPISVKLHRGSWQPKNYSGRYRGLITLRQGLAESVNTVAVQLSELAGVDQVITTARKLGITSRMQRAPSIALGALEVTPLELTTAYAHLASGGKGVRPFGIRAIRARDDNKLLYEREMPLDYLVIQEKVVAMMNDMLNAVMTIGTGRGAAIGRPAAGKTGTTSDYKDAWFIGYTPDMVAGVWVGNDDATPTAKVTGGSLPAQIWKRFMQAALEDADPTPLPMRYAREDMPLPWQDNTGSVGEGGTRQPGNDGDSVDLGRSFWDKLFDRDKIEYEYPGR